MENSILLTSVKWSKGFVLEEAMKNKLITVITILCIMMSMCMVYADDENSTIEPEAPESAEIIENTEDTSLEEDTQANNAEINDIPDNTEKVDTEEKREPEKETEKTTQNIPDSEESTESKELTETEKEPIIKLKASGDKVSYTAKRVGSAAGETSVFSVTADGITYTGACAEQGVSMNSSGKATITRIDNSTKIAKVIYYYAIALGDENWWTSDHKTDKVGKIIGMDHADDTNVTKRRMLECFCQIYNMGASDWYQTITSNNSGGWSKNTADKVRDYYNKIDTSNISVPASFIMYKGAPDDKAQEFIAWSFSPRINVKINKSANTAITGNNGLYSLSGTSFSLYASQADAKANNNPIAKFDINASGSSATVSIDMGNYYLVETKAGAGLLIPDSLKASNGGKLVDITKTATINIS